IRPPARRAGAFDVFSNESGVLFRIRNKTRRILLIANSIDAIIPLRAPQAPFFERAPGAITGDDRLKWNWLDSGCAAHGFGCVCGFVMWNWPASRSPNGTIIRNSWF